MPIVDSWPRANGASATSTPHKYAEYKENNWFTFSWLINKRFEIIDIAHFYNTMRSNLSSKWT